MSEIKNTQLSGAYIYIEPGSEAKIIMQQQERILDLLQRIAELEAKIKAFKNAELMNDIERIKSYNRIVYLEEQLRWRPVSEKPTESDFVLILYNGYRIPDTIYYDVEGGWLCADMPDYWRPIPELEVKGE